MNTNGTMANKAKQRIITLGFQQNQFVHEQTMNAFRGHKKGLGGSVQTTNAFSVHPNNGRFSSHDSEFS